MKKQNFDQKKNGSYALIKGMKNVGDWLANNETGKNLVKGASLVGTALGGATSIIRRAISESPKIAVKMGAEKEGSVVKGLEKIAGASKFLTPMGMGRAATGWVEKWQKSLQESHQERSLKKFREMTPEERMMRLTNFHKSTLDKLMGVLTSKKTALVVGGIAGLAFVMTTGDVSAAIAEGHFNFGGAIQEHVPGNVVSNGINEHISDGAPSSSEFASDHVFTEADMAAGNLDEKMADNAGNLEEALNKHGLGEEQYVTRGSAPENLPVSSEHLEKVSVGAPDVSENHIKEVPPQSISENVQVKDGNIKNGSINFGPSHKMPESPVQHPAENVKTAFEQHQQRPPITEVPAHQTPSQPEVVQHHTPAQHETVQQQPISPKHVENVQHNVAESNLAESSPQPVKIHGERHAFTDKQPDPNKIPFNQYKGFEVGRIIPNVPGAENFSVKVLAENPISAERIARIQEAAITYFGEAGKPRGDGIENMRIWLARLDNLSKARHLDPDALF